jgi:hypothetical protein
MYNSSPRRAQVEQYKGLSDARIEEITCVKAGSLLMMLVSAGLSRIIDNALVSCTKGSL